MVNLEHKLTVDDLIVEYMICKIENGYEPEFTTAEFITFLDFFESKLKVEDSLYLNEKLFNRFFERKNEHDWSTTKNWSTIQKEVNPHMEMIYSEKEHDYIIKANYRLSCFDRSIINTYFMNKKEVQKIRNIIREWLSNYPKRELNENREVENIYSIMGKYLSAEIIDIIWKDYVKDKIKTGNWPKQCTDIDIYLLEVDLAEIIGLKSIKKELLKLYEVLSKRIAILFNEDSKLKISSYDNAYMSYANYKLLINGYEDLFKMSFGPYKRSFLIDMEKLSFTEKHEVDRTYAWDEDPEIKSRTILIGEAPVRKLVRSLDKYIESK